MDLSAHNTAVRILGTETQTLDHPMWREVVVLNGMVHAIVREKEGGPIIWAGILDSDHGRYLDRLVAALPECVWDLAELSLKPPGAL